MGTISITCPACQQVMYAQDNLAGKQVKCTRCQQAVSVPDALAPAERVASSPASAPVSGGQSGRAAQPVIDYAQREATDVSLMQPLAPRIIDRLLDMARIPLNETVFQLATKWGLRIGELVFYVAVAGYLLVTTIAGIKSDSVMALGIAWGSGLAALMLAYVALKIMPACLALIRSTPSRVASSTLLDCMAFVALAGTLGLLVTPLFSIRDGSVETIVPMFVGYWLGILVLLVWAVLALNPRLLNITVDPGATAGEEFLGIVSFLTKGSVAILPITFATGAVLSGVLVLLAMFFQLKSMTPSASFSDAMQAVVAIGAAAGALWAVVLIPIVTGLLFLLIHLFMDLCQAILAIPSLRGGNVKSVKE